MKFEHTRDKGDPSRDSECYRRFLAGEKTLYTKAFWENGPYRGCVESVDDATSESDSQKDGSLN